MKFKLYILTLLIFLGIDSIWLGFVAPSFYRTYIGFIMKENPDLLAAGLFYLLFVFGMVTFVVEPGVRADTPSQSVLHGALFGLVTYATYDLTNLATLEGWPVIVTVVDMAWGTILSGLVAFISIWVGKGFLKSSGS